MIDAKARERKRLKRWQEAQPAVALVCLASPLAEIRLAASQPARPESSEGLLRMDDLASLYLLGLPPPPARGSRLARKAPLVRPSSVRALYLSTPPLSLRGLVGVDAAAVAVA